MGAGFVIFLHLIALFVVAVVIAMVAVPITYFVAGEEKRTRKLLLAGLLPFEGLFSFYLLSVFGLMAVSEIYDTSLGIGDTYYVPLTDKVVLQLSDDPWSNAIETNGETAIKAVEKIGESGDNLFVTTKSGEYFIFYLPSHRVDVVPDERTLLQGHSDLTLIDVWDFYREKKWGLVGIPIIFVVALAAMLTALALFVSARSVVKF